MQCNWISPQSCLWKCSYSGDDVEIKLCLKVCWVSVECSQRLGVSIHETPWLSTSMLAATLCRVLARCVTIKPAGFLSLLLKLAGNSSHSEQKRNNEIHYIFSRIWMFAKHRVWYILVVSHIWSLDRIPARVPFFFLSPNTIPKKWAVYTQIL